MRVWIVLARIAQKPQNLNQGQLIDNQTDSFKESWHAYVVYIFDKLIYRPFFFAILASEVERFDGVVVEGGYFFLNYRIMTVDSHCLVIVRDRESENLSINFFLRFASVKSLIISLNASVML